MTGAHEIVEAVLLVGGLGTRLRPLTYLLPKALLPVGNLPLVGHQLLWLGHQSIKRVRLAAGYQAEALQEGLGKRKWPVQWDVVVERQRLDTAGALRLAATGAGTFLAANGDLVLNPPLDAMVAAHKEAGAIATILLRRVEDVSHFGLVVRDEAGVVGNVVAFLEKQPIDPSGQRTVNAGLYIMEPEVLEHIPPDTPWSVERQLFPQLVRDGERVIGFLPEEPYYWLDVGRLETYLQANFDVAAGRLPWWNPGVDGAAHVSDSAELIEPVVAGAGAVIGERAQVGPNVVLGEGAAVGPGAVVRDTVLWPEACVGAGAKVVKVVVATGGVVDDETQIEQTVVMPK